MAKPFDSGGDGNVREPFRVRLPGFVTHEDVGLGDVIKRTTSYLGIRPCNSCTRRADSLNRRLVFTTRTSRER
jgi:hypothetical protein